MLVRNEHFWGKKPTVEKITFRIVPETATRVAMLRSGQLDIIYSPTPADIPALEADSRIKVFRPPEHPHDLCGHQHAEKG